MSDLFTALNETGVIAENNDALNGKEATNNESIEDRAGNGQAQSDRSLVGVLRRHVRKDNVDYRKIHGRYRKVPLNEAFVVQDLQAEADRLGLIPCEVCHRRVLNVARCSDIAMCPRCTTAAAKARRAPFEQWRESRRNGAGR